MICVIYIEPSDPLLLLLELPDDFFALALVFSFSHRMVSETNTAI